MSDTELQNIVDNHERAGRTDLPRYQASLDELQRRRSPKLNLDITIRAILESARHGKYLSYGQVAAANGCDWTSARRAMPRHLDLVLAKSHARGAPLITAIVVNQKNLATGTLDPSSLTGFIAGAKRLRIPISDEQAFLQAQQQATFAFAQRGNQL